MKGWLWVLAGVVLLSLSVSWIFFRLDHSSTALLEKLETVEEKMEEGDWEGCFSSLKEFRSRWEETKPFWAFFLHHMEMDNIDQALVRAQAAVQSRSKVDSRVEMGTLRLFIRHIPERERLSWENVF